jgi:hypothetical protein
MTASPPPFPASANLFSLFSSLLRSCRTKITSRTPISI